VVHNQLLQDAKKCMDFQAMSLLKQEFAANAEEVVKPNGLSS